MDCGLDCGLWRIFGRENSNMKIGACPLHFRPPRPRLTVYSGFPHNITSYYSGITVDISWWALHNFTVDQKQDNEKLMGQFVYVLGGQVSQMQVLRVYYERIVATLLLEPDLAVNE